MANQQISLRDVVDIIPIYSGGRDGVSFRDFSAACLDARDMVSDTSEEALTKLIRLRLTDGALHIVRHASPNNIAALLKSLKGIYAPRESLISLYGDLSRLYQQPNEDVASYFYRTRILVDNIIEAYKNEHDDEINEEMKSELENECGKAFVSRLDPEIYVLITEREDLNKAGPDAVSIEAKLLVQKTLRSSNFIVKIDTCLVCEGHDHDLLNCPSIQSHRTGHPHYKIFDQEGHSTKTFNNSNTFPKCQLCEEPGHLARQCKNNYYNSTVRCQICNRKGHEATNCNQTQNNMPKCHHFNRLGHETRFCRTTKQNACQLYKKFGHQVFECHYFKHARLAQTPTICQTCDCIGHNSEQCRSKIVCQFCKQIGHTAKKCPKIANQTKVTELKCQYCLKPGHTAECCSHIKLSPKNNLYCNFCTRTNHVSENCLVRNRINTQKQLNTGNQRNSPTVPGNSQRFQSNFQNFSARETNNTKPTKIGKFEVMNTVGKITDTTNALSQNPGQLSKRSIELKSENDNAGNFKYN